MNPIPRRGFSCRAVWLAALLLPLAFAACGSGEYEDEETAPVPGAAPAAAPAAAVTLRALAPSAYNVEWGQVELPPSFPAGKSTPVKVTFRNASDQTWPDKATADPKGDGSNAVRLSYRWLPAKPAMGDGYVVRVDLPRPLPPGESMSLTFDVKAPDQPGDHQIQFDLVQELVAWFEGRGAAKLVVSAKVQ